MTRRDVPVGVGCANAALRVDVAHRQPIGLGLGVSERLGLDRSLFAACRLDAPLELGTLCVLLLLPGCGRIGGNALARSRRVCRDSRGGHRTRLGRTNAGLHCRPHGRGRRCGRRSRGSGGATTAERWPAPLGDPVSRILRPEGCGLTGGGFLNCSLCWILRPHRSLRGWRGYLPLIAWHTGRVVLALIGRLNCRLAQPAKPHFLHANHIGSSQPATRLRRHLLLKRAERLAIVVIVVALRDALLHDSHLRVNHRPGHGHALVVLLLRLGELLPAELGGYLCRFF